jgi:hypothetical protein
MQEESLRRPKALLLISVLMFLGMSVSGYAVVLNTEQGKRFADESTWMSVVVGNSLLMLFLRFLLPKYYWNIVALSFVVAGTPMIARSLLNKS